MLALHRVPSRYRSCQSPQSMVFLTCIIIEVSVGGANCQCSVLCMREHARKCSLERCGGMAWQVNVQPHETLFRVGDSSEAGIFIVVEGRLGVFLQARLRFSFLRSQQLALCAIPAAHHR